MKAAKVELDIEFLGDMIMEYTKSKLNMTDAVYHEKDGTIWVTYKGKTYSAHLNFEECPF